MSKVNNTHVNVEKLADTVRNCLEDNKGLSVTQIPVSELTTIADYMIIATGSSSRHVRALAINLVSSLRDNGIKSLRIEGEDAGEWAVIDYGDVIVHVMQSEVRSFYDLESLWSPKPKPVETTV